VGITGSCENTGASGAIGCGSVLKQSMQHMFVTLSNDDLEAGLRGGRRRGRGRDIGSVEMPEHSYARTNARNICSMKNKYGLNMRNDRKVKSAFIVI
jgi:hypothetical protein